MSQITIIGSLNYDLVTFTDRVPAGGETYQAMSFETHLGGKGLNESLAAVKLSPSTVGSGSIRMIGNVGDDSFGTHLKQVLVDNGVDTTYVTTLPGVSSGTATILVEKSNGENRILIVAGANGELKPDDEDYHRYFPNRDEQGYVILQNEYPDTLNTISWLHTNRPNINICYNPSPFQPELINEDLLSKIDLLIVNEGEATDIARILYDDDGFEQFERTEHRERFTTLAEYLFTRINHRNIQTIVITLGSSGSLSIEKQLETVEFWPAATVEKESIVDTTGAGDTFFGGLVSNLASGNSFNSSIKFATVASSLAIQKKGAAESIPTYGEVKKLIN